MTLLRVWGNTSAADINLMFKASELAKCWWLVCSLCSHSCPHLFYFLCWTEHFHKDVSCKNTTPRCCLVRELEKWFLVFVRGRLSDCSEWLCLAWSSDSVSNHESTKAGPKGDVVWVMGDRGLRRSVKMTCVLLSQINVVLVRGQ